MRLPSAVIGALEIALNDYLAGDAEALRRCAELDGRCLAVHVRDLDLTLFFLPARHGIQVATQCQETPDVRLSGGLRSFARTLAAGEGGALGGDLRIDGDVGLAQGFARMLRAVDLDLEDWLARHLGDVPAHLLGRTARDFGRFARRAGDSLSYSAAEYLREETRDLVHRDDIDAWMREVDELRARADRLAARINRLRRH